jgi:hypothetical protein
LDLSSWKLKFQDPLRQFKPRKLSNQPVIRLGHIKAPQLKTGVAIKITPPKAIERGVQARAELALENIQRKCQSLFKATQRVDKRSYLIPFKDKDSPLNGNYATVSKSEDIPNEYNDMQKFTPEFYVRTEPGI